MLAPTSQLYFPFPPVVAVPEHTGDRVHIGVNRAHSVFTPVHTLLDYVLFSKANKYCKLYRSNMYPQCLNTA